MSTRRTLNGVLMGVAEAAAFLGNTEKSLWWLVKNSKVPYRRLGGTSKKKNSKRLGGRIVFMRDELEQFIRELPGVSLHQAQQNRKKNTERTDDERKAR